MPITRNCIIKNNKSGTSDNLYIRLDEDKPNVGYLLFYNHLLDYAGIEIYVYDHVLKVVTVYDYFYKQDMSTFDQLVDFWHGMSDKEKLDYLFNKIPWQVEECNFRQFDWSDK